MKDYNLMTVEELKAEYDVVTQQYNQFKDLGLALDLSRGKPSNAQLDLSKDMIDKVTSADVEKAENGLDARNYGGFDGLPETKRLFAQMLDVPPENVIIGGNSSLNLMYDTVARSMTFGVCGSTPWSKLDKIKFLCPVPGYDRHFAICELFGIDMINIPMTKEGPDMDMVRAYVEEDESIKGIWCVPMYENPMGITYSDEVVKEFGALKPKAKDFRIFWDNAYCVHHFRDEKDTLLNVFDECKNNGNEDMIYEYASTSKITFSGAGVSVIASSKKNLDFIRKHMTIQTIGHNKINQLMHVKFLKDIGGINSHMKKHAEIVAPKFDAVITAIENQLDPCNISTYTNPHGGYFVSFNTLAGCAKRVGELCKSAGVTFTSVGATFPYGIDPYDSNVRIAPTYPDIEELNQAMKLFCICVRIATIEKLIRDKK